MGREITGLEVAIVGMAGRLPGANSIDEYWRNIVESRPSIVDSTGAGEEPGYVPAWGALSDVDRFDAAYFGYTPRDAALLDPQQRLLLETAVHTLEHAGYAGPQGGLRVGVYASTSLSTYLLRHLLPSPAVMRNASHGELILANDKDMLATRVSYHLDLSGPSVTVQTACSSSLVAVHMACQSLLARDCDLALAGGVSVEVPQHGYRYEPGGVLSPDGRCRPFDAAANGMVPGSGVAMVALKCLDDALRDRDTIHAVILGTAINNDGGTKVGFTAPRIEGQAAVIRDAQRVAGVDADAIGFVEAHGTATSLGDPIEVAALTRAFRATTTRRGYCALGAVKALIGHLDAAAGVAGLVKAVRALQAGVLPGNPYLREVNPALDLDDSPFYLPTAVQPWPAGAGSRYAAVSSFGMGGTNAHAILQQAPPPPDRPPAPTWQVLPLSAETPAALARLRAGLAEHLTAAPDLALADVAYTLQKGRRALTYRAAVLAPDTPRAVALLTQGGSDGVWVGRPETRDMPVAFLFPGQGAQHPGMAGGLYDDEPVFRECLDEVAALLRRHGIDLLDLLYGGGRDTLTHTSNAQPALFAVEYALARLWMSWGLRPRAMIGHSVGEYVAACLAGTFSLDDAVALVAARGALMGGLPPGAMLAVGAAASDVAAELTPELTLAADNGPSMCVVAGESAAVDDLAERLARKCVSNRRLRVSHAFHSSMMEPVLGEFAARVGDVKARPPEIPFVSCATGDWITPEQATDPWYWAGQAKSTVRFREGAARLLAQDAQILLEVGPGQALSTLVKQQAEGAGRHIVLPSLPRPDHPRRDGHEDTPADGRAVLAALARAWLAGAAVDWDGHWPAPRGRVPLPGYPFERQRHWIDAPGASPPSSPPPAIVVPAAAGPEDVDDSSDGVTDQIRSVWTEMLGIEDIGVHDDFFSLGGHSLLATRVIARINDQFGVALPGGSVFDAPTVAGLSDLVWSELAGLDGGLVPELLDEIRRLSDDEIRAALDGDDGSRSNLRSPGGRDEPR